MAASGTPGGDKLGGVQSLELAREDVTFADTHARHLAALEKRLAEENAAKRKQWQCHLSRMRQEFLHLYPVSKAWGSDELINDPLVARRRGSTDVLDAKQMRTLFLDYPAGGRCYKLRFDVAGFDPKSVRVTTDGERISVRARCCPAPGETTTTDRPEEYVRKIEKPREVDASKLKCLLTTDGILVIEAPAPLARSPSRSSLRSSRESSGRSRSPSDNQSTTSSSAPAAQRIGQAMFTGVEGERVMSLLVDVGTGFQPKEITVQILKDNILQVKARHEERTSERFSKSKFSKEYELSERIEPYSVRAALHVDDGRLVVGALGKGHVGFTRKTGGDHFTNGLSADTEPCPVLDLATFPPVAL